MSTNVLEITVRDRNSTRAAVRDSANCDRYHLSQNLLLIATDVDRICVGFTMLDPSRNNNRSFEPQRSLSNAGITISIDYRYRTRNREVYRVKSTPQYLQYLGQRGTGHHTFSHKERYRNQERCSDEFRFKSNPDVRRSTTSRLRCLLVICTHRITRITCPCLQTITTSRL